MDTPKNSEIPERTTTLPKPMWTLLPFMLHLHICVYRESPFWASAHLILFGGGQPDPDRQVSALPSTPSLILLHPLAFPHIMLWIHTSNPGSQEWCLCRHSFPLICSIPPPGPSCLLGPDLSSSLMDSSQMHTALSQMHLCTHSAGGVDAS